MPTVLKVLDINDLFTFVGKNSKVTLKSVTNLTSQGKLRIARALCGALLNLWKTGSKKAGQVVADLLTNMREVWNTQLHFGKLQTHAGQD